MRLTVGAVQVIVVAAAVAYTSTITGSNPTSYFSFLNNIFQNTEERISDF